MWVYHGLLIFTEFARGLLYIVKVFVFSVCIPLLIYLDLQTDTQRYCYRKVPVPSPEHHVQVSFPEVSPDDCYR